MIKSKADSRTRGLWRPNWTPPGIYYFKGEESGYPGKSIAEVMFKDHQHLQIILKEIVDKYFNLSYIARQKKKPSEYLQLSKKIPNKSELLQHLIYYLEAGERLIPDKPNKVICQFCGKKQIRNFIFIDNCSYGFDIDSKNVCCDNDLCKKRLIAQVARFNSGSKSLRLIKFSLLETPSKYVSHEYRATVLKESFYKFLSDVFDLPEKRKDLTPEIAHNFFLPNIS